MTDGQILRQVRPRRRAGHYGWNPNGSGDRCRNATPAPHSAGGLGEPIVSGLALSDTRMILSGAIPAALLALAVDATLAGVERFVRPGR